MPVVAAAPARVSVRVTRRSSVVPKEETQVGAVNVYLYYMQRSSGHGRERKHTTFI